MEIDAGPVDVLSGCDPVCVRRIGTQVVVRLSGPIDDRLTERLDRAVDEVARLALTRVVIDLDDVESVEGAGLTFVTTLGSRWRLRLVNTPARVRPQLPSRSAPVGVSPA